MKQKTRILIYILVAVAFVILGSISIITNHKADKPVTAQEKLDLGMIYLTDLSYEKAVLEFTEAIEIEPLNADAYLGLAKAYVGMEELPKAVEILEKGYGKTGDERLKDMLDELLSTEAEETAVTTIAATEETTTVSTAAMAIVPDLSGLIEEEAAAACEAVGLRHSVSYDYSDEVEEGYVISQLIPMNASIAEGVSVPFTISKGAKAVTAAATIEETTTSVTTAIVTTSETSIAATTTVATEKITTPKMPTVETAETTTETTRRVEYITILGQQYSTLLTELDLSEMELTNEDIKPISDMVNLTTLNLSQNEISDISALSSLTNLNELHLEGNYINDISALSKLKNLKNLYLGENQISNISVLSNFSELEVLSISDNKISNIGTLSKLTKLKHLNMDLINFDNPDQIVDISALSNLANLEILSIDDNQISNISALYKLKKLQNLSLKNCELSNEDLEKIQRALPNCEVII